MDAFLLAGRYRLVRLLGRGAMGEVWLADDELLHRTVAVKSVLSTADPALLDRIVTEARLAARLNHPNAVAVHDLVVVDDRPYVVMEYVAGRSLAQEIAAAGALPPHRVRQIGAALADALAEAHRLGIVHRDVKPANVLISERGVPKLADFGIARSVAAAGGSTASHQFLGTPSYVSPEVVHGSRADARSDVWSLGAALYAALEGRAPFQHSDDDSVYAVLHRVASQPVPPPTTDPATGAILMRLLDPDPALRPSAADVATLLRNGPAPDAQEETLPNTGPARPRTRGRVLAAIGAVVVLVAALVAGVVYWAGSGDDEPHAAPPRMPTGTPSSSTPGSSTSGSTASSPPADSSHVYAAPGGLIVEGPPGWVADTSAGIANVRDYRDPAAKDRVTGAYFRIGIANERPADSIRKEALGTQRSLEGTDNPNRYRMIKQTFVTFLGVPAVDQEYRGVNAKGVERRFVLRLWMHAGATLEIEFNTPAAQYDKRFDVFEQLSSKAKVV